MICVSSFRPFDKCTDEIRDNQLKAFKSWLTAFDHIVLFGAPCAELGSCKTEFVECECKPSIARLATVAAAFTGWSCIVNADIIIDGPRLAEVQWKLHHKRCQCALSRRWCTKEEQVIDSGLDWFAATSVVWAEVAKAIPDSFCLGRIMFDTWLASYFSIEHRGLCADCTEARFVWHPPHTGRIDQNFEVPMSDKYLQQPYWPTIGIL